MDEQTKLAKAQHDLKRWLTRLKRAVTMVDKLQLKCTRLNRKIGASQISGIDPTRLGSPGRAEPQTATAALVEQAPPPVNPPAALTVTLPPPDDLSIPKQFLRGKQAQEKDDAARAEITAAIEARKAVKARASKARSIAKAKGELRKMPLSGKAALAFITQK